MTVEFAPTEEQEQALGLFSAGCHMAIVAGAGTGKTSTLELLSRSTRNPGTLMAFNRAIINDCAARMPMNVEARTLHSLGMRAVGHRYRHRLDAPRVKSFELARMLGITSGLKISYGSKSKSLSPGFLASQAVKAVRAFCASGDDVPALSHIPRLRGIDEAGSLDNSDAVREFVMPFVDQAWADLSDPEGKLPYNRDHSYYLKAWQLGGAVIPGSFVMVDEAQDLSGVMLAIVAQARARGQQTVLVGDPCQQIYEWMGAVDALDKVDVDARTYLTQSWRFGGAVAGLANLVLEQLDAELRLRGNPGRESKLDVVGVPDAILTRSNACAVESLLKLIKAGHKPHLVGGGEEVVAFARGAIDLQQGRGSIHPDLACFDTWGEVQQYVADDAQGDDLALLVKLLDEYGAQIVLDALTGMIGEDNADVVISTAHKSKGREWDRVRLGPDFQDPEDRLEEWRLLYVAVTRAKLVLDHRSCEPLVELLNPTTRPTLVQTAMRMLEAGS